MIPKVNRKIIIFFLILVQCSVVVVMGFQKRAYHIDEIYSYVIANSQEITRLSEAEWLMNTWIDGSDFDDFLIVKDGEQFHYTAAYRNTALDAHPPLYYWLLHTVSSVFSGMWSKWFGIVLNLLCFVVTQIYVYKISSMLIRDKIFKWLPVVLYGFSPFAGDTVIFIRMYMLLTMFTVIYVWQTLRMREKNFAFHSIVPVCITLYLGSMTQYYFLVFAFMVVLVGCIYQIKNREIKKMLLYGGMSTISVLLMCVSFPVVIMQVTGSPTNNIGNEVVSKIYDVQLWLKQIVYLIARFFNRISYYSILSLIILVVLLIWMIYLIKRKKSNGFDNIKNDFRLVWLGVSSIFAFLLIAKIGGDYVYVRYIYFLVPVIYIIAIAVFEQLVSYEKTIKRILVIGCILFSLGNTAIGILCHRCAYLIENKAEEVKVLEEYFDEKLIFVTKEEDNTALFTSIYTEIREFEDVYIASAYDTSFSERIILDTLDADGKVVIGISMGAYWYEQGYTAESVLNEISQEVSITYKKVMNLGFGGFYYVEKKDN